MKVTILGNNSALPAFGRHPTSQVVSVFGEHILFDCGEATQSQMQRFGLKWRKMHYIFISHMHGDHYFGLPGLINSMSLLGRIAPVHLYAPKELAPILDRINEIAETELSYPFYFHELEEGFNTLVDNEYFKISSFPVIHRIPCYGFLVESKTRGRKLLPEKCREHEIPSYYYEKLKQGHDYEKKDGTVVKNEWVTADGPHAKKYAYCADTLYTEDFLPYIMNADTIYHESTYLSPDAEKARARFHSTAEEAAKIAKLANAKQLLLGHYSSKYRDLNAFEEEAKAIFENSIATIEGTTYTI